MLDRFEYLQEMGIDVWVERNQPALDSNSNEHLTGNFSADISASPSQEHTAGLNWKDLAERVSSCTTCGLHLCRSQTVFGSGDRNTALMIVGEAPGAEEDRQGEPFVGRAGQLLNSMLLALGFAREQVFITNILKCRPPDNRGPKAEEVAACADYLKRQISLVEPKAILAVGRVAAQNLLGDQTPIGKMRGRTYQLVDEATSAEIPVIVTYHPAYLLRSPQEKRKSWDDLVLLKRTMEAS